MTGESKSFREHLLEALHKTQLPPELQQLPGESDDAWEERIAQHLATRKEIDTAQFWTPQQLMDLLNQLPRR
ncbi:MAG TPA: hypothetical protein VHA78_04565 [Candidatus Peribacteraceae bacterium]|nr:hypothetical protein [Candidatus Peribacteraceae bacterium]